MAVQRTYCVHHPERLAIGVCVETKKPICGECSTRYNGVNYSREGLELLRRRRESGGRISLFRLAGRGLATTCLLTAGYYAAARLVMALWGPS